MAAPTYTLRPTAIRSERYLTAVAQLADEVLGAGQVLAPIVDEYRTWAQATGREEQNSHAEYLVEALTLGVLWRARGHEATIFCRGRRGELLEVLVGERRGGEPPRRDGSTSMLVALGVGPEPGRCDPSLTDIRRLLDWLTASGEYDDELGHLLGWMEFLHGDPEQADRMLRAIVDFAIEFEKASERRLGVYTEGVRRFLEQVLPARGECEDTVQCSRQRIEYHLNMVGAEILNRTWRAAFLACPRHVVVLPGCARRRPDGQCTARRFSTELRCSHCTVGCAVSAATRVATRTGSEALAVIHGSDFSRFLRAPTLRGGDVGIVGVACVPGLLGAGWRVRATGLPAQCVLLQGSGCAHWCATPAPTSLDLSELARILRPDEISELRLAPVA